MNRQLRDLSLAFAAGAVGALANSIAVWLAGDHGLTAALDVKVAPQLTAAWLYPRLVWGGLWGLLLVLPILERAWFWRGLLFGLAPSAFLLFYFFPERTPAGMMGLNLGMLTPLVVVVANAIWGVVAAGWYRMVR